MKKAVMFFTILMAMVMTFSGCGSAAGTAGASFAVSSVSSSKDSSESSSESSAESSSEASPEEKQERKEGTSSAGSSTSGETTSLVTSVESLDLNDMFSDRDQDASYDVESAVQIRLNGSSAEISGDGASAEGSAVTITEEGTYYVTGTLTDGQIIVEADENAKVQIVLDGVDISCSSSACILVRSADKVFVTLADGSENTLSDAGTEYVQESEEYTVDGVIFSREDLTLNGSGKLTVNADYKHAVVSKDDLVITGGTYEINAKNKGLAGKDSVRIMDGSLTVTSGDDAIHTSNAEEAGKGFVYIAGGTLKLAAGDDGIHAETALLIADGTIDVTESYEGLEGASIDITGGDIRIKASDDGMNASISDGDSDKTDGIENDGHMFRDDSGNFDGQNMENEAGTSDTGAQMTAHMGGGGMMDAQPAAYLRISGGNIYVNSEGDGLDSNGMLYIDGGTITVSGPTNSGNGALDYGTGASVTGGTIVAAGSAGMAETFGEDSTQYSILYNFESAAAAGSEISVTDADGNTILQAVPEKEFQSVVISSPDLKEGTFTIRAGESEETVEVSSIVTTAGAAGGMHMGGRGSGGMQDGMGSGGMQDGMGSGGMQDGMGPGGMQDGMGRGGKQGGMGRGGRMQDGMNPDGEAQDGMNPDEEAQDNMSSNTSGQESSAI